jgi:hypothetical protein
MGPDTVLRRDGAASLHRERHVLDAAQVRDGRLEHLRAPAPTLGVPLVHAQQVRREQRRLLAALPRLDLQEHVTRVVRVTGHEDPTQRLPGLLRRLPQHGELLGEGRVVRGELGRRLRVIRGLAPGVVGRHDPSELGVTTAQGPRAGGIGVDGGIGELVLDLRVLGEQGCHGVDHRSTIRRVTDLGRVPPASRRSGHQ